MMRPGDVMPDWVASRAATVPQRAALIVAGKTFSYSALDEEVSRMARRLAFLGVRHGDNVATLLRNGLEAAIIPHATLRLGAVLVPLNVRLSVDEISWQLRDTSPRVLVIDSDARGFRESLEASHPALTIITTTGEGLHGGAPLDSVDEAEVQLRLEHAPDTVLAIIYTSGTTGRPKGAMLTVGNFWWNAIGSALNLGVRPDDRWLVCLPMYHVGGLSIVMRSAIYGICARIHAGFDAGEVNSAIDRGEVTMISLVAVMLERMLDARSHYPYPPILRCVLLGGGPAMESLLERCGALSVPVVPSYGLTETCSQVVAFGFGEFSHRVGAVGRPLYPNQVRIDAQSHRDGHMSDSGQILVRGPVVMAGYAGRPEETSLAIVDGWLRTGDIGRIDDDGYLHVLDRREDLIVTGGENVYPAEVEAALLAHPGVLEVAVVGLRDATWGHRIVAVTRLSELNAKAGAVDVSALTAHCRTLLASYKTPRDFVFVTQPLPRTASGKLQRSAVREMLSELKISSS